MTEVQRADLARLRAQKAQAFYVLIEQLQQPIISYLYRMVGEYEVAQDLTQDTFLQAYKQIGKISVNQASDAWVFRIATRYGLKYLDRQRHYQIVRFASDPVPSVKHEAFALIGYIEGQLPQSALISPSVEEQTEMRLLIEQALASLKPKDVACLQLYFANGFTYKQIGKIVSTTPEAARKRVMRGAERFRVAYGKVSSDLPLA